MAKPKATTMTDMKCPYCRQELVEIQFGEQRYWTCINDKCDKSVGLGGNKKLWQELINSKEQIKKLRKQNRILRESLGEYFNKWINASIQAIKDKDQIRVLTEQEQARHQAIIDQIKGGK